MLPAPDIFYKAVHHRLVGLVVLKTFLLPGDGSLLFDQEVVGDDDDHSKGENEREHCVCVVICKSADTNFNK